MEKRGGQISPCSVSKLNLKECLVPVLKANPAGFVLDIGGDTVFRKNADNEARLEQVRWLKHNFGAMVVTLTAERDVLRERFLGSKNRRPDKFDEVWESWKAIGEPYWDRCSDFVIDTTSLPLSKWSQFPAFIRGLQSGVTIHKPLPVPTLDPDRITNEIRPVTNSLLNMPLNVKKQWLIALLIDLDAMMTWAGQPGFDDILKEVKDTVDGRLTLRRW